MDGSFAGPPGRGACLGPVRAPFPVGGCAHLLWRWQHSTEMRSSGPKLFHHRQALKYPSQPGIGRHSKRTSQPGGSCLLVQGLDRAQTGKPDGSIHAASAQQCYSLRGSVYRIPGRAPGMLSCGCAAQLAGRPAAMRRPLAPRMAGGTPRCRPACHVRGNLFLSTDSVHAWLLCEDFMKPLTPASTYLSDVKYMRHASAYALHASKVLHGVCLTLPKGADMNKCASSETRG